MKEHIQTFSKGINQDISTNKYPKDNIYWAQNFRLVTKDGLSTGALTNVKGTVSKVNVGAGHSIVGYCMIRDTVILFTASDEGGKIFKWDYNVSDYEDSPVLIYHNEDLVFDVTKPIRAVGRYETPSIQKIYFTDGNNFFKFLNIIPEEGESYPLQRDIRELDLVSDVTFKQIGLEINSGGSLKAGRIQYAYQLYNKRGSETSISPESRMLSLINDNESSYSSIVTGDEVGTVINKSISVSINDIDSSFERIRIYALEYTVFDQIPSIRIVGEYDVESGSLDVVDSGQSLGEITLNEFRFIQNEIIPATIESKDDILFAANYKQKYFRITPEEFDTRIFRFNKAGQSVVYDGDNALTITYSNGSLSTLPDISHEAYNRFNSVHGAYSSSNHQSTVGDVAEESLYKYNPVTGNLGGYGPNISFEFTTSKMLLDSGRLEEKGYLGRYPRLISEAYGSNYINPFNEIGYQRDEVYRFSIVPIGLKGEEGFALWTGDIKFPNNTEMPFITYEDNKTYGNILGIKFNINIPDSVKDKISGYRIARVLRKNSDRTIVAQGLVGYAANGGPDSSDKYQMMLQASQPLIGDMFNETPSYGRLTEDIALPGDDNNPSAVGFFTRQTNEDLPIESEGEKGFNPKYIEFTSAETAFNKGDFEQSGTFIEAFGVLTENDNIAMEGPAWRDAYNRNQMIADKFKSFRTGSNNKRTRTFLSSNRVFTASEFRGASSAPENDITVYSMDDGRIFNNKTSNLVKTTGRDSDGNYRRYGLKGIFNLCIVDDSVKNINSSKLPLQEFYNGNLIEAVIGNYKVDRGKGQYGGTSYEARSYNTYIPVTEFIDKDTTELDVYGGDTFINFFVYARSLWGAADTGNGDTIASYVLFPVESTININLRLDPIQRFINWGWNDHDDHVPNYQLSETVQDGVLIHGSSYPQEIGNLYRYNSAYSTYSKGKEYYAEPFDFSDEDYFDVRITASDVKINGEYIDSWTKFKFNNNLDVDSKHNAITKLITFKNQLFYFQSTGIGVASVNQRSLIQDNQPGQLALGTGGVLTRKDYITEQSGSEFYDSIVASDTSLYYADGRRKRINKLVPGKEEAISVIKGIDSLLDKKRWYSAVAGFDKGFNEVVFSIDGLTLAFSESADGFMSSYTFSPKLMITIGREFFSVAEDRDFSPWMYGDLDSDLVGYSGDSDIDPTWDYIVIGPDGTGDVMYKHNTGNSGDFYGDEGADNDSYVTLIINPAGNLTCIFDNLDLRTESTTALGEDVVDDIFYRLEMSNNYQEMTRELAFLIDQTDPSKGYKYNTGSISRLGRKWRTPLIGVPTSGNSYPRMMDTYIKLTLRYQNTNKTFRLHDVSTYFRPSNH